MGVKSLKNQTEFQVMLTVAEKAKVTPLEQQSSVRRSASSSCAELAGLF